MKLPNGQAATVEIAKLSDYCLSSIHPLGRHKARVFQAALNLTAGDAQELYDALKIAASESEAIAGSSDSFGARYIIDFEMKRGKKAATVRSCWIFRTGETSPRFVTCYVL